MTLPDAALEVLAEDADVLGVYLFGSRAEGVERPDSDWDVALLWREDVPSMERARRRYVLMEQLAQLLGARVDVVDLRAAPPLLAAQAIRGRLLLDRATTTRALFEMRVLGREDDERIVARWVRAALR